ncbi:MAG: hypothetical protein ACKVQS_13685 [Fimbriimonadaceae bacterium]
MRGTQILAGLAMMAIMGAITSYPVNATAAPQLAVAATGVGIAPQINNGFVSGGRRAIETAKGDKAKADAKVKETNSLMDDDAANKPNLSGLAGKVYSAAEIIEGVKRDGAKKYEGTLVKADGVVLKVLSKPDSTLVYVGAPKNADKSPIFAFRMPPNKQFEEGSRVSLEGKFLTRMTVEGMPNDVYLVNATGFNGAAPTADPAKPRLPYDGWKFVGSVETEDGATGVFVKEDKTLYAQSGDKLSEDVKVVSLKAGSATLKDGETKSVVSPW